jgi:predicted N-acetyltransferase YhbS
VKIVEIRPAEWRDREELLAVLERAFSFPRPPFLDFARMDPHLLHEGRIEEHLLALEEGRIVGVAGAYGYDIELDGEVLRGAAIGQVATLPEHRGRGVMGALLGAVVRELDRRACELSWLSGDRRRYGVHGWALGGVTVRYHLAAPEGLDSPASAAVRRMSLEDLVLTLLAHRGALRSTLLMPDFELALVARARGYAGHRLADAWVAHDARGGQVYFGDGPPEDIARLLVHLLARAPLDQRGMLRLAVECADEPTALGRACLPLYHDVLRRPSCMWRVGKLVPLLGKACRMAAARVGPGHDSLALVNTDTHEGATLECQRGELEVREGVSGPAVELDTLALSELCFGPNPLEHALPGLRPDSPLRQVFPLRVHQTGFFPV